MVAFQRLLNLRQRRFSQHVPSRQLLTEASADKAQETFVEMRFKPLLIGAASFLPGLSTRVVRSHTGGSGSATYCYGVWLKHLSFLWASGMRKLPETVAELGPGDSIGTGLCAVLSGANRYYALDVIAYTNPTKTLRVFDDLITLFQSRAARPSRGWPDYDSCLDAKLFPSHILTEPILAASLAPARIASIRQAIMSNNGTSDNGDITIRYVVPWSDPAVIIADSLDLAISHSVLEHIEDLDSAIEGLRIWLRPEAYMSHQTDFSSHEMTRRWNGHFSSPEWAWRILKGKRPYLINRVQHSAIVQKMRGAGFDIECELINDSRSDSISRRELAPAWTHLSDSDLYCRSSFIQARKCS